MTSLALTGSRARGDSTTYSDWDVKVETSDLRVLAPALPKLIAPLNPIATLWDRLSPEQCFMFILRGPVKVDIIIDLPHEPEPAYDVTETALQDIDTHFWDWVLWLTSKVAKGQHDLVRRELEKLHGYVLEPMGVDRVPRSLPEAVDTYATARDQHEARFGVALDRRLALEVDRIVRRVSADV